MNQITWLGHSTFEIQFDSGDVLVLDPWIDGNPAYPQGYKLKKIDAIALSHAHSDHAGSLLSLAKEFSPKVVAIFETASYFGKKGVEDVIGMNKGGTVDLGFVKLTMTHALHSCSIQDGDQLIYGGEAAGYVLTFPDGRTAYFAGDTTIFGDMNLIGEIYKPELAFLPIGDHYTMGPHEAAHSARLLKVKTVIPMHYGTFPQLSGTPEQLSEKLTKDGIAVQTLKPAEPFRW